MSIRDWERMARGQIVHGTDLQYRAVARIAWLRGCGIWHAGAVVAAAERCWCARCNGGALVEG